jgi:glutamate/tyrosine decarboxylase-like PLP-dependent enzyme
VRRETFVGIFTTGSTMGNRVGLHTAMSYCPDAFIYFSSVTLYSVKKIVRDSDEMTRRWDHDTTARVVEIPADFYGRMLPEELVKQVMKDRSRSRARGETYKIVLLANIGTTFEGGRDDVPGLRKALREVGADITYVHADGALDSGFSSNSVSLGPPSATEKSGVPVVQGNTLSHHKAFEIMVSGGVICYSPMEKKLAKAVSNIDPRAVFETWLFQRLYWPTDLARTSRDCLSNANRLRHLLEAADMLTLFNPKCFITLIERLPSWMIKDFHLAPEGNWVY